MEKYGTLIDAETIRFERLLPGTIETVWEYLTDSEKRGKWLATGETDAFEGGKITFHFMHANLSPDDDTPPEKYKDMECGHTFSGKVLRYQPPNLISFTWNDNSEVKIELHQKEDKVLLVLTHQKLVSQKGKVSVASGWHTHLGILQAVLAQQIPKSFWETHQALEETYAARIATE